MPADIINLRQARKQKARSAKDRAASENRQKFGRTKAQRRLEEANKVSEKAKLDGSFRQRPEQKDEP